MVTNTHKSDRIFLFGIPDTIWMLIVFNIFPLAYPQINLVLTNMLTDELSLFFTHMTYVMMIWFTSENHDSHVIFSAICFYL